ncbi:YiiX/YebB-like N1pC/P60 family cysteine hydrolase [Thiothrix winogradskyi]|uniref:Permuted papain-like amidase enzyme, YaeF/YiiX, C92 family n=1 Tax=Thiothrix winogradskyi TaxID=96472 RepID=A0ABY3ST06_9GAMM|nr:YiiX/YebB-like N1pC/P60 family cysteine hydrolase [Thiothrix winogradskyi]UJS22656.1 hypothetical protein L2Y54_11935 [Thiothrix winogradskyi]
MRFTDWLWKKGIGWLNTVPRAEDFSALCNFEFLEREIRPADVILFAGQSRVSKVIQTVVLSPWTHAALYVGRLNDIRDPKVRSRLAAYYDGDLSEPLVIESLLGKGTIVTPLRQYRKEHLRICRPATLTWQDADKVVNFGIEHLGMGYDVRQLLDLARFIFPYAILPRCWRSSLFQHNAGQPTHIVCSSMIARCFQQVHYPILPIVHNAQQDEVRFYERNFRLITPSDFDYSPYFSVIKYPAWNTGREPAYRTLPWHQDKEASHELVNKIPAALPEPPDHASDETAITTDLADGTGRTGQRQRLVGLRTLFRQAGLGTFARSLH